jgi:hypothetical protein
MNRKILMLLLCISHTLLPSSERIENGMMQGVHKAWEKYPFLCGAAIVGTAATVAWWTWSKTEKSSLQPSVEYAAEVCHSRVEQDLLDEALGISGEAAENHEVISPQDAKKIQLESAAEVRARRRPRVKFAKVPKLG